MQSKPQKTLAKPVVVEGVGLHTGVECRLKIKPSNDNAGLFFTRTDLDQLSVIRADVDNVIETNRGTVLEKNGLKVHTVEHILAALYALGIDNAEMEISGHEPPILDGSALPFVTAINEAGFKVLTEPKDILKIDQKIRYIDSDNDIELIILPHESFKITFFMDYGLPNFGLQYSSIEDVALEFESEIAPARTFGLLSEITTLKDNGLIKGGNLGNAVVFVDQDVDEKERKKLSKTMGKSIDLNFKKGSILNAEGLRYDNEPVRHKVLDLIGDLSLFGRPLLGHVIAKKSGHSANIELVKLLRSHYYEN